ncbi:MAG: GTP 3',8-cyclase MoaA [Candidatus Omnitrophica bacterium]|nr:GTP 3',8-cyclase MoaA [Candidatus Omnitrophota bacterium]
MSDWIGPRPHKLDWSDLYLRLSVTDACNFRCQYCRPVIEEYANESEFLSFEGIERLIGWCYDRGSRKVRLTGGEPLLRKNLPDLVRRLHSRFPDIDLSLSTNGLRLPKVAKELKEAGLNRINISLDTLNREKFRDLTGVDGLDTVLDSIEKSQEVGFDPVKLNVVLLRGSNEDELADLVRFALERNLYIRFIEYMPHCKTETNRFKVFSSREALDILSKEFQFSPLEEKHRPIGSGPARYWKVKGYDLPIGLISSVTEDICANCHRLRVTARGELVRCIQLDLFENIRDMIQENRQEDFYSIMEAAYEQRQPSRPEGHVFFLGMQLVRTGG